MERKIEDFFERHNGQGWTHVERLLDGEQLGSNVKMYAKVTIDVDAGIGFHQHVGDQEAYYFLEGEGDYINHLGAHHKVVAGDVTYTGNSEYHGIYNAGNTPLIFMALIVKSDPVTE